jgi:hypothetical protein
MASPSTIVLPAVAAVKISIIILNYRFLLQGLKHTARLRKAQKKSERSLATSTG